MHLVDSKFGSATEAVFGRAQNAVHIMVVTLKLDNCIDDMFKNLWTCYSSFLIYMTYKEHGYTTCFGKAE